MRAHRCCGDKLISPGGIELMQILEELQEIVDAIFDVYEREGIAPTVQERQQILTAVVQRSTSTLSLWRKVLSDQA